MFGCSGRGLIALDAVDVLGIVDVPGFLAEEVAGESCQSDGGQDNEMERA